jgi:PAS domain S-box-containing protein
VRIARAQASLQRVIETAPLAIALFDADTQRVQQLNQMAAAFFGRPIEELLGRAPSQWNDWLGADEVAALKASLTLAGESSDGVRREITRGSGATASLWDTRFVSLPATEGGSGQVLVVASDVTEQRVAEQARLEAAIAQREMLVKEVHHRIKNNLQGVAGLLQQTAARQPEVSAVLTDAVAQVQAIAQVYGLQVGSGGPVAIAGLLAAIAGSVQRTFGCTITVDAGGDAAAGWQLPEAESIPVALTVNELLTNAIKHGDGSAVECTLRCLPEGAGGVAVAVANRGRLAEGFDLARVRPGAYGLGLVRALLPRRSGALAVAQEGDRVVARVTLAPPSVRRASGAP